jgi:hypothetical protein
MGPAHGAWTGSGLQKKQSGGNAGFALARTTKDGRSGGQNANVSTEAEP